MSSEVLFVVALGFFLGVRHATDADHVIAVTTIVSRQRALASAALTGLLWGVGHTVTIVAVGAGIILLGAAIPPRLSVGMELSVGLMLIVLGAINIVSFVKSHPSRGRGSTPQTTHAHGDYVHSHGFARPVAVGIVHGLAGSAAVMLMVGAAVADPRWAVGYLLVFGLGTMTGMMVITVAMASALRALGGRSEAAARHLGLVCGVVSVAFGVTFTFQIWASGTALAIGH
jgi:high-affinity nickel-transport protein